MKNPDDFLIAVDRSKPSTWRFRLFSDGIIILKNLDFAYDLLTNNGVLKDFYDMTYTQNDRGEILQKLETLYVMLDRNKPTRKQILEIAHEWKLERKRII